MLVKINGREIECSLSGWGDNGDEIQINDAKYTDTGEDATDDDIDEIYDNYQDRMYEVQFDNMCGASDYYEGDR